MKKLLPIILIVVGLGAGLGAGIMLKPPPPEPVADCAPAEAAKDDKTADGEKAAHGPEDCADPALASEEDYAFTEEAAEDPTADWEYLKLSKEFLVPLLKDDRVSALIVISLSLEMAPGASEGVFAKEPKLRDAMLQILFDHGHAGGFSGIFTAGPVIEDLRRALKGAARRILGSAVNNVLITDIVRRDL